MCCFYLCTYLFSGKGKQNHLRKISSSFAVIADAICMMRYSLNLVHLISGWCAIHRQRSIYFCLGSCSMPVYGAVRVLNPKMDHSWRIWNCSYHTCRPRGNLQAPHYELWGSICIHIQFEYECWSVMMRDIMMCKGLPRVAPKYHALKL